MVCGRWVVVQGIAPGSKGEWRGAVYAVGDARCESAGMRLGGGRKVADFHLAVISGLGDGIRVGGVVPAGGGYQPDVFGGSADVFDGAVVDAALVQVVRWSG